MENAVKCLENQLEYAEKRLQDEKNYVVEQIDRLSNLHKTVDFYEELVQEYRQALEVLRNHR